MPDAAETRFKTNHRETETRSASVRRRREATRTADRRFLCVSARVARLRWSLARAETVFDLPRLRQRQCRARGRSACRVLRGLHGDALLLERRRLPPDR